MKKIFCLFCLTYLGLCAAFAQKTIFIANSSDDARTEVISIPYAKFSKHFAVDTVFRIIDQSTSAKSVHQIERLGSQKPQNVLVLVTIPARQSVSLIVKPEKQTAATARTYARFVPERFDDFAWENDVVAFRLYGKALEGRKDDAQGMDFWAKRTDKLVINDWYKTDDYHKDHGQGLDYYGVGQTLGAGDLALFANDQVFYTKHYRKYEILDNGPLRTSFRLTFEPEQINGHTISLTKTITLDAGEQFNKITVQLYNANAKTTAVVVGLAKRGEDKPAFEFDHEDQTLAYWEPSIADHGNTGTALILPESKVILTDTASQQLLIHTSINNKKAFTYYNGAAWSKAGKITCAEQWFNYVENKAERIKKPLKIQLK